MAIIGIDLGTSNSCVAVHTAKRTEIVRNELGDRTTPSVLAFAEDGSVIVGQRAYRQAVMNPERTIIGVKRLVGRAFDSDQIRELQNTLPYDLVRARNGDVWVAVGNRQVSPAEAQAYILEALRNSAESFLATRVDRAVITVPAFFDEAQRQATRDAAEIAGLRAVRLLSEPTAAALAYGYAQASDQRVVVFDLGGGTLDVTVMAIDGGRFEVLATAGDTLLGGADFDRTIANTFVRELHAAKGIDLSENRVALQRLVAEAELAKKTLTQLESVEISLPYLATTPDGPINFDRHLAQSELARLIAPLVERMLVPCRAALAEAGLGVHQIDDVLLVGGMTRSPVVHAAAESFFGRKPSLRINPDEAIAIGAALQAGILQGDLGEVELVDVAPRTIGLRVAGDRVAPLIPKSSQLPARVTKAFATTQDQQRNVELFVVQGESAVASENRRLANVQIEGFPPAPKGQVKVGVTFEVDVDGVLSVSARRIGSDDRVELKVTAASGLGRAEVQRLAKEHAATRVPPPEREASERVKAAPSGGLQFKRSPSLGGGPGAPRPAAAPGGGFAIQICGPEAAADDDGAAPRASTAGVVTASPPARAVTASPPARAVTASPPARAVTASPPARAVTNPAAVARPAPAAARELSWPAEPGLAGASAAAGVTWKLALGVAVLLAVVAATLYLVVG